MVWAEIEDFGHGWKVFDLLEFILKKIFYRVAAG